MLFYNKSNFYEISFKKFISAFFMALIFFMWGYKQYLVQNYVNNAKIVKKDTILGDTIALPMTYVS